MKACPNFNDPEFKQAYDAIKNDPELNQIEAMREYIASVNEDRPMRTPQEVKKAREEYFMPKSESAEMARIADSQQKIKDRSNDPVYNDPDTLMGLAIMSNDFNVKNLNIASNSATRGMEMVRKMSDLTGVPYQIISIAEAAKITQTAKNPYDISKGPAFFYGGTVYFVGDKISSEIAFHEFAHPFVRAIQYSNPVLFDKLYKEALAADPSLQDESFNEYKDLEMSEDMKVAQSRIVAEEVVVKALTKAAMMKEQQIEASSAFAKAIKNILYAIKQQLRKLFGQKVNVAKLDVDTTLDQLAEMLVKGNKFDISTENVAHEDIVSYYNTNMDYIKDMRNVGQKLGNQKILALIRKMYEGASMQIDLIMRNKNYAEMVKLLADEYNRGDLQEIRSNLKDHIDELEQRMRDMQEDVKTTQDAVTGLVGSIMRLEVMMEKMENHLAELEKDPTNRDNVHRTYYYTHVVDYWQKYIEESMAIMDEARPAANSAIMQLMNSINTRIKRIDKSINKITGHGINKILWDQWKDMSEHADKLFADMIDNLTKRGASERLIQKRYLEYYGMNREELAEYESLKARQERGDYLNYEESIKLENLEKLTDKGVRMTEVKVAKAMAGQGRDASWANSYLEGYLYNTDPVIGGFAKFYDQNMSEVDARASAKVAKASKELKRLCDEAGINFNNLGNLGDLIGFVDKIGYVNQKGEFELKEVLSLAHDFKDYRYDNDKFEYEIKKLREKFNRTNDPADENALAIKIHEYNEHLRKWFHDEFVPEFYDKDALLTKDDIGIKAAFLRQAIFTEMRKISNPVIRQYDILKTDDLMAEQWNKYRQLYSLHYANGDMKTNSYVDDNGKVHFSDKAIMPGPGINNINNDLAIAQRLQEHREYVRKFYTNKEREGAFQNALRNFENETRQKLVDDFKMTPGTEEFNDALEGQMEQWIKRNTRVVLKPEFYAERARILNRIKEITAKLPSTIRNDVDFSESWKNILDITSAHRDDDGQPIGNQMNNAKKAKIKAAQEKMQQAKESYAGYSGLTVTEMDDFIRLCDLKKQDGYLSPNDYAAYIKYIKMQKDLGLSEAEKAELGKLFAELKELQSKRPTDYYFESVNSYINAIGFKYLFDNYGIREINSQNYQTLFNDDVLAHYFEKSPEFEKWFNNNHVTKKVYDSELKRKVDAFEPLYVWNVITPNNQDFYETTEYTREDGTKHTVPGLPAMKYYTRVVKKEYRTGYDKTTGEVKPIIGIHKDNRGEWLPKNIAGSPYINEKYQRLKNADPNSQDGKIFKILEKAKEYFLSYQEGIGKRGKLYMDFPRFPKSELEILQTTSAKEKVKEKTGFFQLMLTKLRNFFKGSAADALKGLNEDSRNILVRADAFDDQIENIPIQGLYNLTVNETSKDFIHSMFRYMYAVEHHKQLVKMNPIAQGIRKILNDPKHHLKEPDKINRSNFINLGQISFLNKKGKYIRKDAFNNFYEREFLGKTQAGALKDEAWIHNIQNLLFKRASLSFFALNIPSALKNTFGQKLQNLILAAGGYDVDMTTLVKGEAWSGKYMMQLSFGGEAYTKGQKTLEQQLAEAMDPLRGRTQEKIGESFSRTIAKDAASLTWLYSFRKWTEVQAGMQTFGAMMYKKTVEMNGKQIPYMEAWELNSDGLLQLKAGVDPKWGITYDQDGNMVIGEEFKKFKSRVRTVMTKLNGAYSKFDQPEMQRYVAFRFISFLRRYFITMAMNRFGKKRWNVGYGEMDEGYYVTAAKSMLNFMRTRNFQDFTREDKVAFMKLVTEVGTLMAMSFLVGLLWDWDDRDEERFEKLRERSGHLPFPLTSENESGNDFDLGGFLSLHALNLMMQVRAENEQFIPWPGYGLDNLTSIIDLKSQAFGPTTDTYRDILGDLSDSFSGDDRAFYKRRVGPYEWQDQGGRKLWAHIGKMLGLTGASIDPAQAITSFQKAQNLAKAR